MTLGRAAFGIQGNKLPAALSYISNVGWETVLVTLSAQGGAAAPRSTGRAWSPWWRPRSWDSG